MSKVGLRKAPFPPFLRRGSERIDGCPTVFAHLRDTGLRESEKNRRVTSVAIGSDCPWETYTLIHVMIWIVANGWLTVTVIDRAISLINDPGNKDYGYMYQRWLRQLVFVTYCIICYLCSSNFDVNFFFFERCIMSKSQVSCRNFLASKLMTLTGNEYVISLNKLQVLKVNKYVSESRLCIPSTNVSNTWLN